MDGPKMKLKQPLTTSDAKSLEPILQRQLQRLQAPRSLISFTEFTCPRYETAGLHRQIAEQLERVERGEIDRLMLLVPPRHSKAVRTTQWASAAACTVEARTCCSSMIRSRRWPTLAASTFARKRGSGSPARRTTGWKKMVR